MSEINAYFMGRESRDYWSRGFVIGTRLYPRDRLPQDVLPSIRDQALRVAGKTNALMRRSSCRTTRPKAALRVFFAPFTAAGSSIGQ